MRANGEPLQIMGNTVLNQHELGLNLIGIYRVTNTITNQTYIGQSINIERRFMEHKTPKSGGNDRLHNDIKKYGLCNFRFEVVEECTKDKLKPKELQYIKCELPYYNTVGKPVPQQVKDKLSVNLKKWWNNLDNDKQQAIIHNNLRRPPIGHSVSQETRQKISKRVSEVQKQKIKIIETNQIFDSVGELEQYLGACTGTVAAYLRGKIKSVKGFHVEKCRD